MRSEFVTFYLRQEHKMTVKNKNIHFDFLFFIETADWKIRIVNINANIITFRRETEKINRYPIAWFFLQISPFFNIALKVFFFFI